MTVGSGRFVWASGPWPAGSHSDIRIFRAGLRTKLGTSEFVIADAGCIDSKMVSLLSAQHSMSTIYASFRALQETSNRRLKNFAVRPTEFRYDIGKQVNCFFCGLKRHCASS